MTMHDHTARRTCPVRTTQIVELARQQCAASKRHLTESLTLAKRTQVEVTRTQALIVTLQQRLAK